MFMGVPDIGFIIAIIASLWVSLSTTFHIGQQINDIRDAVITGKLKNGEFIDYNHRRLMFENDWILLCRSMRYRSLIFSAIICLLPCFFKASDMQAPVWLQFGVAFLVASISLGSALGNMRYGPREKQYLDGVLQQVAKAEEEEQLGEGWLIKTQLQAQLAKISAADAASPKEDSDA